MKIDALPSLHDGHLLALSAEEENAVTLVCKPLDGGKVSIRLNDVIDFCANNFRNGNIILSIDIHRSVEKLEERLIRSLAQSDRVEHVTAYRDRMRAKDASGGLRYFVLLSSYGCDLVGICAADITVE
jgi:hypothetical protein